MDSVTFEAIVRDPVLEGFIDGLDLSNLSNEWIGDEFAIELAHILIHNESILELNLSSNLIGNDGMDALGECLVFNTTLQYLNLGFNPISDLSALRTFSYLESLSLEDVRLDRDGLVHISKLLPGRLKYLNLASNKIKDVSPLAQALIQNTCLLELDLSVNEINEPKPLANMFSRNHSLEKVHLQYNPLSKSSCLLLLNSVSSKSNLMYFNLTN